MNIRLLTGSGLAVAVVMFFTVNVLSHVAFRSARVDLTEQRLYTLTEGSRNILQGLDEPVTLRVYLSKETGRGTARHSGLHQPGTGTGAGI